MTTLIRYDTKSQTSLGTTDDFVSIVEMLDRIGVLFERWQPTHAIDVDGTEQDVLDAYRHDIARICAQGGYRSVDCIRVTPDHPDKTLLREKFLKEHTHSEDEVRFFVEGAGLFYLHVGSHVYSVLCTKGDFIGVPSGITHWFDMGSAPDFTALRFFTSPDGWIAEYTRSDIATKYPEMDSCPQ